MSNNEPDTNYHVQLQNKINEKCYQVFYKTEEGKALLQLWELKHFRSPVAFPNKEPAWAYFNEGQNEFIRAISAGINTHMNQKNKSAEPKQHKRKA